MSQRGSPKKVKPTTSDLFSKVSAAFNESLDSKENDADDPEEMNIEEVDSTTSTADDIKDKDNSDLNLNVNCGVCGKTFDTIDGLESHIEIAHNKPQTEKPQTPKVSTFVAKEGGWKCNLCSLVLRTSRQLKAHKSKKECSVLKEGDKVTVKTAEKEKTVGVDVSVSSSVRTYSNACWQQSESRNWAAEFGYNKNSEDEEEDLSDQAKSNSKPSFKPKDILNAMKLNFSANMTDSTSDDEEEDESDVFLKDGRSVSMQNREPRLLSDASRQTRKRLEVLTKQAQEVMKEREKAKDDKKKIERENKDDDNSTNNNNKENIVEDGNLDGSGDNDLLIPLSNGWVCEKTGKDSRTHFWSPEGLSFQSVQEIENYAEKQKISLDVTVFRDAVETVNKSQAKSSESNGLSTVRIKDEETGLPMVIIFPGGSDCLTMDVSATA